MNLERTCGVGEKLSQQITTKEKKVEGPVHRGLLCTSHKKKPMEKGEVFDLAVENSELVVSSRGVTKTERVHVTMCGTQVFHHVLQNATNTVHTSGPYKLMHVMDNAVKPQIYNL
jgi:hypothetical protein